MRLGEVAVELEQLAQPARALPRSTAAAGCVVDEREAEPLAVVEVERRAAVALDDAAVRDAVLPEAARRYSQGSALGLWLLLLLAAPVLEPQLVVFALVRYAARRDPRPGVIPLRQKTAGQQPRSPALR